MSHSNGRSGTFRTLKSIYWRYRMSQQVLGKKIGLLGYDTVFESHTKMSHLNITHKIEYTATPELKSIYVCLWKWTWICCQVSLRLFRKSINCLQKKGAHNNDHCVVRTITFYLCLIITSILCRKNQGGPRSLADVKQGRVNRKQTMLRVNV